jgi:hypothetical protein
LCTRGAASCSAANVGISYAFVDRRSALHTSALPLIILILFKYSRSEIFARRALFEVRSRFRPRRLDESQIRFASVSVRATTPSRTRRKVASE